MRHIRSPIFLIVFMGLLAAGCTTGTQKSEPRRPAGQANGEAADRAAPPRQIWKFTTGGEIWSSPVIHARSIMLGSDDGNIYSLDLVSGEQKWKFATGGRVRSGGAICDGKALFAGDDGNLYALDADSGSEVWRFDLGSAEIPRRLPATDPPYDYDYMASSPVCSGGKVYTGSADGHLYAVDASTGTMSWKFKTGGRIRSTPRVNQGHVYIGSWDHHVYALDADSGEELWRFDTGGVVQASAAFGVGKIIIGSRNPKVFAVDVEAGTLVWEYVHEDGSWVESSVVFSDGTAYVGSSDALALQALDPATGSELWRFRTGGWSWSTPVVDRDTVYIGAISAYPYYFEGVALQRGLYAVDRHTGNKKWSMDTEEIGNGYITGGVYASPVIADDVIYVAALDGNLYALR